MVTTGIGDTHWSVVQTCQNAALRIATECHSLTQRNKNAANKEHNEMISQQHSIPIIKPTQVVMVHATTSYTPNNNLEASEKMYEKTLKTSKI